MALTTENKCLAMPIPCLVAAISLQQALFLRVRHGLRAGFDTSCNCLCNSFHSACNAWKR